MFQCRSSAQAIAIQERSIRLKEERQAIEDLLRINGDVLYTGILLMICSAGYTAWSCGVIQDRVHACHLKQSTSQLYGMHAFIGEVQHVAAYLQCCAVYLSKVVQGLVTLVLTPIIITKLGLLKDYQSMPVFKLGTSLALICGFAGWRAVRFLGGYQNRWLCLWELWVSLHIALTSTSRYTVQRMSQADSESLARQKTYHHGWIWLVLGILLPLMMGVTAFYSVDYI